MRNQLLRAAACLLGVGLLTACLSTPGTASPPTSPPEPSPTPPSIPTDLPTIQRPTDEPEAEPTACTSDAEFVEDVTVPDGSPVVPGEPVVKTWLVRNTGTCGWHSGYLLVQTRGEGNVLADTPLELPVAAPGDEVEISVTLGLPLETALDAEQAAAFQLQDPDGALFGPMLTISLLAAAPAGDDSGIPTPTPISGG